MTRTKAEKIRKGIDNKIRKATVDMEWWADFWGFTVDEYEEFLDMAIKALEQIESGRYLKAEALKKEPSEDTISRQAVEEMIKAEMPERGMWIEKEHLVPLARDAEPLNWDKYDKKTHSELEQYWHCSECDYEADRHFRPLWKYCPNCGARMESDE